MVTGIVIALNYHEFLQLVGCWWGRRRCCLAGSGVKLLKEKHARMRSRTEEVVFKIHVALLQCLIENVTLLCLHLVGITERLGMEGTSGVTLCKPSCSKMGQPQQADQQF